MNQQLVKQQKGFLVPKDVKTELLFDPKTKGIVITDERGNFKRTVITMIANSAEGDVWSYGQQGIGIIANKPAKPTAKFLQRIAMVTGTHVITPRVQTIGTSKVPNPYIDTNGNEVWLTTRVVGRSFATGEFRALEGVTVLKVKNFFIQKLMKNIKKKDFPSDAYSFVSIEDKEAFKKEANHKWWIEVGCSFPLVTLFIDGTRREIAEIMSEYEEFVGSVLKRVGNIGARNVLEAFFAITNIMMDDTGRGIYHAVCWKPLSESEVSAIYDMAGGINVEVLPTMHESAEIEVTEDGEIIDAETMESDEVVTESISDSDMRTEPEKTEPEQPKAEQQALPEWLQGLKNMSDKDMLWCLKSSGIVAKDTKAVSRNELLLLSPTLEQTVLLNEKIAAIQKKGA